MRRLIIGAMLSCAALSATAADDSIVGTHIVKFQPVQVGGSLEGCELVFMAVTADHAYLKGNHVAANGSIFLSGTNSGGLVLMLKIGVKDITLGSPFERPEFAYIQTASASTAMVKHNSFDSDEGYKAFVYSATDTAVFKVIEELMSAGKVTVGYSRESGGMDVLVPLDLTVVDSEYTAAQKVLRKHSPDAVLGFSDCAIKVIDSILGKLQ